MQTRGNNEAVIAASLGLFGFCTLPLMPLGFELTMEVTYPVDPGTSTGLIFMSGNLSSFILLALVQLLNVPLTTDQQNVSRFVLKSLFDRNLWVVPFTRRLTTFYLLLRLGFLLKFWFPLWDFRWAQISIKFQYSFELLKFNLIETHASSLFLETSLQETNLYFG